MASRRVTLCVDFLPGLQQKFVASVTPFVSQCKISVISRFAKSEIVKQVGCFSLFVGYVCTNR